MTRREALKIKVGDKIIFQEYAVIEVSKITEDKRFGKPSIVFWGRTKNGQVGYPHRMCRRYEDDRTENAVESN